MNRLVLSVFFFAFLLLNSVVAQAGVVGKTLGELGMSEQVQNLGDAVHAEATALAGMAGRGGTDTVRGATGALTELTVNSGELICGAWMISFRVRIRDLIIENTRLDGDAQVRHSQLIQRLQEFTDRLERECTRVGLIGIQANGTANAVGGAEPATTPEPEPEPDTRIRPREGETMADEICRRRCAQQYADMEREERYLAETERSKQYADEQVNRRRTELSDKQQRLQNAQRTLEETNRILRRGMAGNATPAQKETYIRAGQDNASAQREVDRLTPEVETARTRLESAEGFARTVESNLRYQQQRTEAARRAYYDCLKRCLDQAKAAGESTTLTCPAQYKCAVPSKGKGAEKAIPDKGAEAKPVKKGKCAIPAKTAIRIGPNSQYGTNAQLKNKAKDMATGMAMGGLNSVLGGSGISLGGGGGAGSPMGGGGSGGPKTVKDQTKGEFTTLSSGGVELGVRAGFTDDGLVVSQKIMDSPGDSSTFHAIWMEDGQGRRMLPTQYYIYSLYVDHKLTVWWTYDHWTNGVHDYHDEGQEVTKWRTNEGSFIKRFDGDEGIKNSVWYQSGFETAVKGVRQIGALFPVSAHDLADACPVSLVTHVTLPENDTVTTVPFISGLFIDPEESEGKSIKDLLVHVTPRITDGQE